MKVDAKIVPIKEKTGIFSSKDRHQLQVCVTLDDVEQATIQKAGLADFKYMSRECTTLEHPSGFWEYPISHWINPRDRKPATMGFDTLIEAQAALQDTKERLTQLKKAMELSSNAPTEESFEI